MTCVRFSFMIMHSSHSHALYYVLHVFFNWVEQNVWVLNVVAFGV
jgi:hypothetical protein